MIRTQYWSNSKFAEKLRLMFNIPKKPLAATSEEWDAWRESASKQKLRFWLTEDGLDMIQNILWYPIDIIHNVRYYIKNRFFDKLHYLPTRLSPGQYYDFDTRILHGLFEGLVDFVEVEKAHMMFWSTSEQVEKHLRYRFPILRWKSIRSREYGIKYLEWESTLDDQNLPEYEQHPVQANVAREIIALYTWWKDVRPNRKDLYDETGWTEYYDRKHNGESLSLSASTMDTYGYKILDRIDELEKARDKEDEEMMIRLIKIHKHLWT